MTNSKMTYRRPVYYQGTIDFTSESRNEAIRRLNRTMVDINGNIVHKSKRILDKK